MNYFEPTAFKYSNIIDSYKSFLRIKTFQRKFLAKRKKNTSPWYCSLLNSTCNSKSVSFAKMSHSRSLAIFGGKKIIMFILSIPYSRLSSCMKGGKLRRAFDPIERLANERISIQVTL